MTTPLEQSRLQIDVTFEVSIPYSIEGVPLTRDEVERLVLPLLHQTLNQAVAPSGNALRKGVAPSAVQLGPWDLLDDDG